MAHWVYAELLDVLGKRSEARVHINRAIELHPIFYLPYCTSALLFFNDGNFLESVVDCRKAIEMNPDYGGGYNHEWQAYFHLDSMTLAVDCLKKMLFADYNIGFLKTKYFESIDEVFSRRGMPGVLHWLIEAEELERAFEFKAKLFTMIGDKEQALKNLELGYEMHDRDMVRIISDYDFIDLRSEPRYMAIVKKMGLLEYYNQALASGELPQ